MVPHRVIVVVENVKVNVKYHTHPHPHQLQKDDAESKLVVENVLMECVVVTQVGVEPPRSIVILIDAKVNVQARSHKDNADGKLIRDHVLLESVVV